MIDLAVLGGGHMYHKQHGERLPFDRRTVLKAGTAAGLGLAGVVGVSGTAAAASATVGPGDSIQDAVDAASPGDTVVVNGGTYREQVVIDKDLTLVGRNDPTIEAPDGPDRFSLAESGWVWEPVVFAFGGDESGGDVSGAATVDVSVSGFTIDGRGLLPDPWERSVGILARNVDGRLAGNTIENLVIAGSGPGAHSIGIAVYGDSELTIAGNAVTGYSRVGIFATGDAGTGVPDPDVDVHRNTVKGHDDGSAAVPLGIQLSFGADGSLHRNHVGDNAAPSGEGVVIVDTGGVPITGNRLHGNETSVVIGSVNVFGLTPHLKAEGNSVVNNRIAGIPGGDEVKEGVFLWSAEEDGSVDDTKIVNNAISTHEHGVAITTPGEDATADDIKIIRNTFDVEGEAIVTSGDSSTVEHANR